ncbi:MAG: TIGR02757 family protein [Breznakibacter sp.]
MLQFDELRDFLEYKTNQYNCPAFIDEDPISIPHLFSRSEDIEIAALMTAILSWGGRKAIIKSARQLMALMHDTPYEFVMNASPGEINRLSVFVYRTFNGNDAILFINSLRNIYMNHGGLKEVFSSRWEKGIASTLIHFRETFFLHSPMPVHASKHVADVNKGASAKRLNMFLRWMVRDDKNGVDFGVWKHLDSASLCLPLDVHTGNVARKLGLLGRSQNDWRSVEEVTSRLRQFDPNDPIKYDFALFGLGVYEKF